MRKVAPVVTMYIEKFGRDVSIEEDHPLAIAQRESASGESETPAAVKSGSGVSVNVESRKPKREC